MIMIKRINITKVLKKHNVITLLDLNNMCVENNIDIILLYGAITNGIQTIEIAKELKILLVYRLLDISHGLVRIQIIKNLEIIGL